ncbi:hypothetical protein [Acinetobacter wuhouensis]|uniref:Lipoprotein n=1 Tax=Acinetobacter wuhouensis TaxID=1879050 RepID=A0A4Q7AFC4_9GAMM|nr:hypothetical protein [Acinetobacter wuhouensis]RZG45912.1 hypothetical protein EXU28_10515 [Acinetobacter wuhouensis]RZG72223.1 hypothetical protein EXU29_11365 [Acinetobacter wuhouensis]
MKIKIVFLLTVILLIGCEKIDRKINQQVEQTKDIIQDKIDQKIKEKSRDLTALEEKKPMIYIML